MPGPFFMGPLKSLEGPLDKQISVMTAFPEFVSKCRVFFLEFFQEFFFLA